MQRAGWINVLALILQLPLSSDALLRELPLRVRVQVDAARTEPLPELEMALGPASELRPPLVAEAGLREPGLHLLFPEPIPLRRRMRPYVEDRGDVPGLRGLNEVLGRKSRVSHCVDHAGPTGGKV